MVQRFPHSLVHPGNHFGIDAQILGQLIGRLQLIEALQNRNLLTQAIQTFPLLRPRKKLAAQLKTVFRPVTMSLF